MTQDKINYNDLLDKSLNVAILFVLNLLSTNVYTPNVYLTYRTDHPGVLIPDWLKEKYPNEITIVIENQYSNFTVTNNNIMVTLLFDGKEVSLVIPINALTLYYDKNADFHLAMNSHRDQNTEDLSEHSASIDHAIIKQFEEYITYLYNEDVLSKDLLSNGDILKLSIALRDYENKKTLSSSTMEGNVINFDDIS